MRFTLCPSQIKSGLSHDMVDGLTDVEDGQGNIIPAPWRLSDQQTSWLDYHPHCSNNFSNEARAMREEYMTYFNSEGAVPWQWELCGV